MPFLAISELFFSFGKIIKGEGKKKKQVCINPLCVFERFFLIIFWWMKIEMWVWAQSPGRKGRVPPACRQPLINSTWHCYSHRTGDKEPQFWHFSQKRKGGGEEATHDNYDLASPVFIDFLNADEWKCASLIKTHKNAFFLQNLLFFPQCSGIPLTLLFSQLGLYETSSISVCFACNDSRLKLSLLSFLIFLALSPRLRSSVLWLCPWS